MKLRLSGQSLRLRLTHPEVQRLAHEGRLEEQLLLPPGRALRYRLLAAPDVAALDVAFSGEAIEIRLPRAQALEWCRGEDASLCATVRAGEVSVKVAIEKDFDSFEG
jgi:hypothetical protein